MENIEIRRAVPGDEALILDFIRELADYEHMLDEVVATEELLHEWLFEKHGAEVVFAAADGKEVGSPEGLAEGAARGRPHWRSSSSVSG